MPVLYFAWIILLSCSALYFDPSESIRLFALKKIGIGLSVSFLWFTASIGFGAFFCRKVLKSDQPSWDISLLTGLGISGFLLLIPALAGMLGWGVFILFLLGMSLTWLNGGPDFPVFSKSMVAVLLLLLLFFLIDACAPAVDTDSIYYHISLPKQMWLSGGLLEGPLHPNGSRPMILHLPFALLYGGAGELGPPIFHAMLSTALVASIYQRGEEFSAGAGKWALVLLLSSWTFLQAPGLTGNDLPAAYAVLMTAVALRESKLLQAAVLAAISLSIKFTAIGPIFGLWLFFMHGKQRFKAVLITGALLCVWPLRNVFDGLHPLFPFTGWELGFPFQYLEKYGMGRDIFSFLSLPWNLVMMAEVDSFKFLGRLNPLWLAAIPFALLSCRKNSGLRPIAAVSVLSFVVWAAGPHWLRHLLPALPLIAIWLGTGLATLTSSGAVLAMICVLSGLPSNISPLVNRVSDRLPAALGQESPESHRERLIPGWKAAEWASENLPKDASVAMFFCWPGLAMDREYFLGSVEDHIPSRHWILLHQERSVIELKSLGVDHLIVGPGRMPRHVYPFISDAEHKEFFEQPVDVLEELLLQEGEMIFSSGRHRVYRLRKKN